MKNKPHMVDGFWWILPVDNNAVDISSIEKYALDGGFRPKDEKHITIIGSKCRDAIVEKMETLDKTGRQRLLDDIEGLLDKYSWDFKPNEYFHIKRFHEGAEKEAIICTMEMPDVYKLYNSMNQLLDSDVSVQFPHISLFTKGPKNADGYYGIPLPNEEAFKESIVNKL